MAKKLGDEACKAYEEQADLLKSPWRLRQKDYVCSVAFIKASKNAEKIECMQVFLGARDHEDGSHEILVKDTSCFTVAKHDTFCKLLGLNKSRAQNLSPALKRPPESAAEAVKWAENEILTTGLTWQGVGSNVDEYLICFDGTIRRLVSNKKLAK